MSDTSRGPGWWVASDGRWYPPELHPARRAASTPATVPASVPATAATASPVLPSGPTATAEATTATLATAVASPAAAPFVATAGAAPAGAAPDEDRSVAAESLFRRMVRAVVEHYAGNKGSSRRAAAEPAPGPPSPPAPAVALATAPAAGPAGAAATDPFAPIPDHPARSPLSLRRRTPRRSGLAEGPFPVPTASRRAVRSEPGQATFRRDLVLGPASLASGTERHHRVLPLGTVFAVLLLAIGAVVGVSLYRHRPGPHDSPVNATQAFIKALYDNSPRAAQSMIVPGQQLDVPTHPAVPISFGAASVTNSGGVRSVSIIVCITPNGQGCGSQSGNGTSVVVPTRQIRGSWYVDQNLMVGCDGQPAGDQIYVCQG